MNIIGVLLLGFLGTLILIFGFLAYEIWSVLQIYHTVTDVASVKNLKKIQRLALLIIDWWKKRKSAATILLLMIILIGCHDVVPGPPMNLQESINGEYYGENEEY